MNTRTGWNRRWLESRNPALEALETRLVLSQAAQSGLQPLLSHAEQHGKPATPGVTIDSLVGKDKPKADLPFVDPSVLLGNSGSTAASAHFLPQDSLTDARTTSVQPPISQSIEASVVGISPSEAKDVAKALEAFGLQATAAVENPGAGSTQLQTNQTEKRIPNPLPEIPSQQRGVETNSTNQTPDPPTPESPQPASPTERAAPQPANANAGLAQAAASAEQAASTSAPAPSPAVEALPRQGTPLPTGQSLSNLVNSGRFVDGYVQQQRLHESQELSAGELTALPIGDSLQARVLSPAERLALLSEAVVEAPLAPLSADLILNFLPCNVAAVRTAIENLLTDSEQLLLSGNGRDGLALGLLVAALVTSGMAGHAAWERVRGRQKGTDSVDWLDGWALTRRLAAGLQLAEMP